MAYLVQENELRLREHQVRKCRMKSLGVVLAILVATTHAGEPRTFYARAQIVTAHGGTVVLTAQYEPVLDLPSADCIEGQFTCLTEQRYGQLYRFDFLSTQLRGSENMQVSADASSVGRIYLAADMDKAQELQFEESVSESIAQLHGDSFRHAYAGWRVGSPPFEEEVLLGPSRRSAWFCMEDGDAEQELRVTPHIGEEQVIGATHAPAAKPVVGKTCESFRTARRLEGGLSTTTAYDIESLVRTTIVVSVDWYLGDFDLGGFQPLPDEMLYEKTEVDEQQSRGSMTVENGVVSVERSGGGVNQKLRLGTYDIKPPSPHSAAWVTRWSISTLALTFGAEPTEKLLDRQDIWILALPLSDPLAETDAELPGDPGEKLLDTMTDSFDRFSQLNDEVISQAFQERVAWMLEGDWMFIYCPTRRAPQYSIARFSAKAKIANGEEICDTARGLYASK